MNHLDPLAALREADPFSTPATTRLASRHDRSALLREITASDDRRHQPVSANADRSVERRTAILMATPRRKKRWASALPVTAAAAVAGLVIGATTLLGPGSTQTASATVVDAAQEAADLGSGEVTGTMTFTSPPDQASVADTFEYRYSGRDYVLDYASGEESLRIIGVGDMVYTKESAESQLYIPEARDDENASVVDTVFDLSVETAGPAGVVGLLQEAEDVSESENAADGTRYQGTLSVKAAASLDKEPLALALIEQQLSAEEGVTPGPYRLEAVVVDGLLESMTVTTSITKADEVVEAVVVTDFTDLGTTQEVSAPAPDEVRDYGRDELTPEMEELFAIVDDFNDRHPEECNDMDLTGDSLPTCMEEAGESEAAKEIRRLQGLIPIEDWGA